MSTNSRQHNQRHNLRGLDGRYCTQAELTAAEKTQSSWRWPTWGWLSPIAAAIAAQVMKSVVEFLTKIAMEILFRS